MKKRIVLTALFLALLLTLPVFADLLYVPQDDWLVKHYRECVYEDRNYYVNGPEGYVLLQKTPEDGTRVGASLNGTVLRVYYVADTAYGKLGQVECVTDADGWCVRQDVSKREKTFVGWVPMDEMTAAYDFEAFASEFAADITPWDGDLRALGEELGTSVLDDISWWTYPGAEAYSYLWRPGDDIGFTMQYTDPDGRVWGSVGYYQGSRDAWICLSDPGMTVPTFVLDRAPALIPAAAPDASAHPAMPSAGSVTVWIAAAAAVLLAAAAAILLRRRAKKRG